MKRQEKTKGILLVVPTILLVVLIIVVPLIYVFRLSFYSAHLLKPNETSFVGISNYLALFKSTIWWSSFILSFKWVIMSVILINFLGLWAGLVLNCKFVGRSLLRGIVLIPWVISTVVSVILFKWLLHDLYGLVNYILEIFNIINFPISWLTHDRAFMTAVIIWTWKVFPFSTIVILAGLQTIPDVLYEAAKIDGASSLQTFFYITLPGLRKILIITILLTSLWTFSQFDIIWLLTEGGPGNITQTIAIFGYRTTFRVMDIGKGAANSIIMFIATFIFSISYIFVLYKEEGEF